MHRNHCFILKMLDNGFVVEIVKNDYAAINTVQIIDGGKSVLVEHKKWKYATSAYWCPLGDFYIEADSVEDGIRMALTCAKDFICDEGRPSITQLALFTELANQVQHELSKNCLEN